MSYYDEIENELKRAAVLGRARLVAHADQGELSAEITKADGLAVSFESFAFTSPRLVGASTEKLSRTADALARKLTYLLEPLRVVEVDGQAGAVQMRSYPPYQRKGQTRYYEVLVQKDGSISLLRYERQPGEPRMATTATVTMEVFHRLAEDFAAAAE